jgi:hypothetical protein
VSLKRKTEIGGYSIVQAESHEAATKILLTFCDVLAGAHLVMPQLRLSLPVCYCTK